MINNETEDYSLELVKADKRIAELEEVLEKACEDINWMLNTRQFLSSNVFDYIYKALGDKKC